MTGTIFRLTRPEQRSRRGDDLRLDGRSLRRWLDALPPANLGETAKRLYHTLVELNHLRDKAKDRLRFLTETEAAAAEVAASLRGHYLRDEFPLAAKGARVAGFVRTFHAERALGYWMVVEDIGPARFGTARGMAALALHRVLHHLGRLLLNRYQLYASPAPGLWQQVHSAYRLACRQGVDRKRVPPVPGVADSPTTTPADAYKQLLLLALAGPFGLPRAHIEEVYAVAADWAADTSLGPCPASAEQCAHFRVDLDSDRGPHHPGLEGAGPATDACREFDLTALAPRLRQAVAEDAQAPNGREDRAVAPALLRHLALAWNMPRPRNAVRSPGRGALDTVMGLAAAHETLVRSGQGEPFAQPQRRSQFHATATRGEAAARDAWALFQPQVDDRLDPEPDAAEVITELAVSRWAVADTSEGGYCLVPEKRATSSYGVGWVLGLGQPGTARWEVGVIRWLQQKAAGSVQIGVEVLSRSVQAVAVRPAAGSDLQRAILLQGNATGEAPDSLLVPSLLFRPGQQAILRSGGRERRIHIEEQLEDTGRVARFYFHEPHRDAPQTPEDRPGEKGFGDRFWSDL